MFFFLLSVFFYIFCLHATQFVLHGINIIMSSGKHSQSATKSMLAKSTTKSRKAWLISDLKVLLESATKSMTAKPGLRLNMPMRDLAGQFNISISLCSSLFTNWSKAAAMLLGSVVFMPDQGRINETKPAFKNLSCIIDCLEFLQKLQKIIVSNVLLWSSYKHHNYWNWWLVLLQTPSFHSCQRLI